MTKKEFIESKATYPATADYRRVVVTHLGTALASKVNSMYSHHKYTSIYEAYKRPSATKVQIYNDWKYSAEHSDSMVDFHICSKSCHNFTIGFDVVGKDGNRIAREVLTRDTHYVILWDSVE
jgi:hypothetical protein